MLAVAAAVGTAAASSKDKLAGFCIQMTDVRGDGEKGAAWSVDVPWRQDQRTQCSTAGNLREGSCTLPGGVYWEKRVAQHEEFSKS